MRGSTDRKAVLPLSPAGTVAFFPGCARLSTSFFPYDPEECEECIGRRWGGAQCGAWEHAGEEGPRAGAACRARPHLPACLPASLLSPRRWHALYTAPLHLLHCTALLPPPRGRPRVSAGLPEEVALTKQALARGYAVLALTNKAIGSQCWSSGGGCGGPGR